ncbi:sigma-70 family RNA polymerase sigma factor [Spirillospora sp. CA-294931]|uniref:sigma-70 family RNA polymerase sigma factor n=1 Tax=Spirillospora sp. CA-294931 TaxID=3240042 RepID=UPI003D8DE523
MSETASSLAPDETSDAVLIARIREGDISAYGTLYERHLASARGLARHLVEGDAAEDAVQETFAKILDVIRRGGGPQAGFRPYLLTSVRRTVYDRYRSERRLQSTDTIEQYDPGVPFIDPALEGLERSMIVRAFQSLPERWQAVLWHTEIEGAKPADVAPLLGLTANGVAALAYRAREGLRQAYLQMHLSAAGVTEECRPALDKLGSYVRGGLAKRESRAVEGHLDGCGRCKAIYAELTDVNTALRDAVGPLVLGTAATAYLAAIKGGFAFGGIFGWFRHLPKRQQQAYGAGAVAAAGLAVLGMLLVSGKEPIQPARKSPPAAQAPAPAPAPPKAKPPAARPAPPPPPAARPAAQPKPKPKPKPKPPKPSVPAPPPEQSPPPAVPARLTARIGTVGTLIREQPGIVAMSVLNGGKGRSKDVIADIDLPPDVTYAGGAAGRNSVLFAPRVPPGDGWSCRPVSSTPESGQEPKAAKAPRAAKPKATPTATATPTPTVTPTATRPPLLPGGLANPLPTPSLKPVTPTPSAKPKPPAKTNPKPEQQQPDPQAEQQEPMNRVRCTHAPLASGDNTSAYLRVDVGATAPYDTPPRVTLRSGGLTVSAKAKEGVAEGGMPARFAVDGHVRTLQTGNSLLTCDEKDPECRAALQRKGDRRDNDFWDMCPRDLDDDPSTKSSSSARLDLPTGSKVLWAGLYWSGAVNAKEPVTAKLRAPGGEYRTVQPAQTEQARLPSYGAYQAFADVTEIVRQGGGGIWWGADVPTRRGHARHAGWSLVTVVEDPSAPYQQAMVLDGVRALGRHAADQVDVPVGGLLATAEPARIGVVAWEGDADLPGDRLLLDGRPLTPEGGDADAGNVADGSAAGAIGSELTFGIDVDYFSSRLDSGRRLSFTTRQDAYLVGVVSVTAPMRS